ncbi:MAG: 7,8-didemethyl-8-hydroxy-5-deazariboflavin synthase subunit CofG [Cyanobacteria bacterium]|nr:7,8-didemethyl-8-hydroxy-5-deazariboflavin synthase subunit CofG [Cyanobacteria bacterium CG_2015-16_32_12]NCO78221.1 7,8-didemethyl-8-hydroxy-5-deazariboflavin synthase subunit CofG [Cyanobacteria bacterium CG_2015-22_32_23]NCQ03239.1 7,8-didemethyl-8-hydroxy-5-deazariboflavin synthase subunit CofG [Cyanobacteria bacterium CG_2015-09_32_10]NCQ41947.1 7,8-didemethyl-8-hydroxy-5-deazariboflavin synthase subunit CofG [Cyanobacteria bacterium CG_2015-04_32_10]NCS85695.1 7,8-didemethyl-8-hydroxy
MSRIITYSPAFTIVPTYECFNRCSYCNFRTDPHQSPWLELDKAKNILSRLQNQKITEILILSGEVHPNSTRRQPWLQRIYDLAQLALSMGFFPHTNVGILTFKEMSLLKEVNFSMGLMLEQLNPNLLDTVHRHAPSKIPNIRLQQLEWAGELRIPFTTGILLGIGETSQDRIDSLLAIAKIQRKWENIQEVILQPYSQGSQEELQKESISNAEILEVITIARKILPESITLQIPPNLINNEELLLKSIELGVRDLGGIVPKDEVNPDYHHQTLENLHQTLNKALWQLKPRLPVYPQYYSWLSQDLQSKIQ